MPELPSKEQNSEEDLGQAADVGVSKADETKQEKKDL